MRYSHMVTVTEDPGESPFDLGPMSEREARELVSDLVAEGQAAELRDLYAEAAASFPAGARVRHRDVDRTGVVTPSRAGGCPVPMEPDYDLDARITVAVDYEHGVLVHLSGDLNGWFVAKFFEVASAS